MVKVIIEKDGERNEFTGDLAIGTVAKFGENEMGVGTFINGEGNAGKVIDLLSGAIPLILQDASKSKVDYISALVFLSEYLEEKSKSELKESADTIAETPKAL